MLHQDWERLNVCEKATMLKSLIRELIELDKNIGKNPKKMYTDLIRKKQLKNEIKDITAFESAANLNEENGKEYEIRPGATRLSDDHKRSVHS